MSLRGQITATFAVLVGGGLVIGFSALQDADSPKSDPELIARGRFHRVAHLGNGVASVYRLSDGRLTLRLAEFRTDESRDLQVLLVAAPDVFENETIEKSEKVFVGALEKVEGDQSYPLPNQLDLAKYRAVTIWSGKHRVNFITAPLLPIPDQSSDRTDATFERRRL
jgi:hypothetical protein